MINDDLLYTLRLLLFVSYISIASSNEIRPPTAIISRFSRSSGVKASLSLLYLLSWSLLSLLSWSLLSLLSWSLLLLPYSRKFPYLYRVIVISIHQMTVIICDNCIINRCIFMFTPN